MILITMLLSLNSHALVTRHNDAIKELLQVKEVKCKYVTSLVGDGCNVCSRKLCTDHKTQWQEGPASCSAKICSRHDKRNQKAYNSKEWE